MRLFRPTYKGKDGKNKKVKKWWIEIRDHLQTVRRFAGFTDKEQTRLLGKQIERLVNYRVAGEQPDAQLSRWLEQISNKLRDRFVDIGLLDTSRAAAGKPLSKHLEDFKQSLLAKASSENAEQIIARVSRIFAVCKFRTWMEISADKIERCLADLRSSGEISTTTSNYYLKSTKQFCKWMIQNRRASESPVEHLRALRVLDAQERRALEPDELRRLLEAAEAGPTRFKMTGHQRAVLYRLAVETGLRRKELRSLTISSFDFQNHTVTIGAAFSKNKGKSTIPLKSDTVAMVKQFTANKLPTAKVFGKITNRTSDMVRADLDDAGIPSVDDAGREICFHSLRHTTATFLADSGVHPKVAQAIMRHGDINLTMSRYTHVLTGRQSEAVEKMPDLSLPSREKQQAVKTGTTDLAEYLSGPDVKPTTPVNTPDTHRADSVQKSAVLANHRGNEKRHIKPMDGCSNTVSPCKNSTSKTPQINLASHLAEIVQKHSELAEIVKSWPDLPEHIKAAVKAIVQAYMDSKGGG